MNKWSKHWFKSIPAWLKGGIIGVIVCIILFFFYILAYFPLTEKMYAEQINTSGSVPDWTWQVTIYTGHGFLFLSHFILEGWNVDSFCPATELTCHSWISARPETAEELQWCVPWTESETSESGCCLDLSYEPNEKCTRAIETLSVLMLGLILLGIYFLIGAGIAVLLERIRKR